MTVRNLDGMFKPASVALIGASKQALSPGAVIARNLRGGGFAGPIMLINPNHQEIHAEICHPDVASLPATPDLAVVVTPPDTVPHIIADLGARGTKAAVVITAGFGEGGADRGRALQQAMLEAARPHLLRIVGPNCFGLWSRVAAWTPPSGTWPPARQARVRGDHDRHHRLGFGPRHRLLPPRLGRRHGRRRLR